MATDKKFAVAGVSTHEGKTKIRFANDAMRVKILQKHGHTDINLIDLPSEMTKVEIVDYLNSIEFGKGVAAIEEAIADLAKKNKAEGTEPKVKVAKEPKVKVAKEPKVKVATPTTDVAVIGEADETTLGDEEDKQPVDIDSLEPALV